MAAADGEGGRPKRKRRVRGSGGGGSQQNPVEAANTLQAKSLALIIDLIGEGPNVGLVNPATGEPGTGTEYQRGILYSDAPLENTDGTKNFPGAVIYERVGDPDQSYIPDFPAGETPNIGVFPTQVVQATPVVRRITNTDVNRARIGIRIPALSVADTGTGDINGNRVAIKISVKAAATTPGSEYVDRVQDIIDGKCVAPYERAYGIELTGVAPWDIKVTRVSPDDASAASQSQTYFQYLTEIVDTRINYADRHVVAQVIDAQQTGGQIPQRNFIVKGRIIKVPSNYNPTAHTYTGEWDGLFVDAWTNNPAWIVYDLLTNDRYGLGTDISEDDIEPWDFYTAGQYCDEMVDDGNGGTEPRFTFNGAISQQQDAVAVIQAVAGMFRSALIWGGEKFSLMVNKPKSVSKLFTRANVRNGKFSYAGTALGARHTVAIVDWINPELNYEPDVMPVQLPESVRRYGHNELKFTAVGCTSPGQAYRQGLAALLTEWLETDTVTFECGITDASITLGSVVSIADPIFTSQRRGGRLLAVASATSVQLDSAYVFDNARTYTLKIMLPNGDVGSYAVTNPGVSADTITIATLPDAPDRPTAGAVWALYDDQVEPRQFYILGLAESDEHWVKVTALQYDPDKFTQIDTGVILPSTNSAYTDINIASVTAVDEDSLTLEYKTRNIGNGVIGQVVASWEPVVEQGVRGYQVSYQYGYGPVIDLPEQKTASHTFENLQRTRLTVWVRTVNQFGYVSTGAVATMDLDTSSAAGKNLITSLQVQGGGSNWAGRDINIEWNALPSTLNGSTASAVTTGFDQEFKNFRVKVYDTNGGTLLGTLTTTETKITITYDQLSAWGAMRRSYYVTVELQDVQGAYSAALGATFTNPAPSLPTITAVQGPGTLKLVYTDPTDPDYIGIRVWASASSGFTPGGGNLVWEGAGNPILNGTAGATVYYVFETYDAFGSTSLNRSTEQTGAYGNITATGAVAGSIGSTELADNAVTTPKIADGAVTNAEIGALAVITAKIASAAVGATQLAALAVTTPKIAAAAVTATELGTGAVTTAKIAAAAVTTDKITAAAVTSNELGTGAVITAKIAASAVTAAEIAALAVTTAKIAAAAVTATELGTAAVTTAKINPGAVDTAALAALAVTGAKIAAATITAANIAAGTITASEIAAGTITASRMVVTDTSNMLFDADFTEALGANKPWRVASGSVTMVSSDTLVTALGAKMVAKVTGAGTSAPTVQYDYIDTTYMRSPVEPGRPYYASVDYAVTAGFNGYVYTHLQWVNSAGGVISYSSGSSADYLSTPASGTATGTLGITATAPTGAVEVVFALICSWHTDYATRNKGGTLGFARPRMRRMANAELIVDGAVTANKIAALTIVAGNIAANTITSDKIVVQGHTLVPDTNFDNLEEWTVYDTTTGVYPKLGYEIGSVTVNSAWYQATGGEVGALRSATIYSAASGPNYLNNQRVQSSRQFPVTAGEYYEFGVRVYNGSNHNMTVSLEFVDYAGAYISNATVTQAASAGTTTLRSQVQAPTGATRAYILCQKDSSGTAFSGYQRVSGVFVRQAATGTLIVDGTITAAKIAANTITAAKIAAGTITATEIAANTITAAKIVAGTITATEIAANTITATQIASGTITATQIAAGTISADRLMTNGNGNLLYGSDMWGSDVGSYFWLGWNPDSKPYTGPVYDAATPADWNYHGQERGTVSIRQTDGTAGGVGLTDFYFVQRDSLGNRNQWYTGRAGRAYTFALTHAAHRCRHNLFVGFYDSSYTYISEAGLSSGMMSPGSGGSANVEGSGWTRSFVSAVAPANTKYILLALRREHTTQGFGYGDSYSWVTKASLHETDAVMTAAPGWEGPNLTFIQGGNIATASLTATQIAANTITAGKIAAGTITATEIAANTITAAKIAAGTITATEIAATTITAAKLNISSLSAISANLGAITAGTLALTASSYVVYHGAGFGASSDLIMWFGASATAMGSATKTNGIFALATDGKVYFGTAEVTANATSAPVTSAVFTKTATSASFSTSGTTATTLATIDVSDVPATGFLKALNAAIPTGSYTLSAGTDWYGDLLITEQLQSGGTEHTLYTIPIQITDTGGGLFDVLYSSGLSAYELFPQSPVAQNVTGNSRYRMKIQRTSGTNNISTGPAAFVPNFMIERTPA